MYSVNIMVFVCPNHILCPYCTCCLRGVTIKKDLSFLFFIYYFLSLFYLIQLNCFSTSPNSVVRRPSRPPDKPFLTGNCCTNTYHSYGWPLIKSGSVPSFCQSTFLTTVVGTLSTRWPTAVVCPNGPLTCSAVIHSDVHVALNIETSCRAVMSSAHVLFMKSVPGATLSIHEWPGPHQTPMS